ncbi:MAG: hypothetical protein KatS3mg077_0199 [Candidatus Binatia bacterium]|nr:MAG: hypothetical protein KatS3mg077_0199 [Candidatus Binatia bacterium]
MCTLAAFVALNPEIPLVIAANRDEFFSRPTGDPYLLSHPRRFVAGVDLVAGGTWLGANEYGLVAAVLNRRGVKPPDPRKRSRGRLVSDALELRTIAAAVSYVTSLSPEAFNPCTILLADAGQAVLLANESHGWQTRDLEPGLHVVTNRESDSLECPRHDRTVELLQPVSSLVKAGNVATMLQRIFEALRDHGENAGAERDPLSVPCVHTEHYGTRSSTVVILDRTAAEVRVFHAVGAPCTGPFRELPALSLAGAR